VRRSFEESNSQLALQGADTPRERRLGDMQALCGAREVFLFCDDNEGLQLGEAHLTSLAEGQEDAKWRYLFGIGSPVEAGVKCRNMVEIFRGAELDALRRAGRTAAETLRWVANAVRPNMSTGELDRLVRQDTERRGGRPSQLGFQGFPAAVCISRNDVVCHGIPNEREFLVEGDIVNIDVTTEVGGFHGDTSRTICVGKVSEDARRIVHVAEQCMWAGIGVIREGARVGDIGAAIVEVATRSGCSVVRQLCGHGIGRQMHAEPQISHVGTRGHGLRLRAGMVITVEPMVNLGGPEVEFDSDGWTVRTEDGSLSAQFEHTVLVTQTGFEVLTRLDETA
jgi:methionyl aminopeptidase